MQEEKEMATGKKVTRCNLYRCHLEAKEEGPQNTLGGSYCPWMTASQSSTDLGPRQEINSIVRNEHGHNDSEHRC